MIKKLTFLVLMTFIASCQTTKLSEIEKSERREAAFYLNNLSPYYDVTEFTGQKIQYSFLNIPDQYSLMFPDHPVSGNHSQTCIFTENKVHGLTLKITKDKDYSIYHEELIGLGEIKVSRAGSYIEESHSENNSSNLDRVQVFLTEFVDLSGNIISYEEFQQANKVSYYALECSIRLPADYLDQQNIRKIGQALKSLGVDFGGYRPN